MKPDLSAGICFWVDGRWKSRWPLRRAGKWGLQGKEAREKWQAPSAPCSEQKNSQKPPCGGQRRWFWQSRSFVASVALWAALPRFLMTADFWRVEIPGAIEPVEIGFLVGNAIAAHGRRIMITRSGGGSCWLHGQSGAAAIPSLITCQGGSMGSMVSMSKGGRVGSFEDFARRPKT